jgi:hypothetical protein
MARVRNMRGARWRLLPASPLLDLLDDPLVRPLPRGNRGVLRQPRAQPPRLLELAPRHASAHLHGQLAHSGENPRPLCAFPAAHWLVSPVSPGSYPPFHRGPGARGGAMITGSLWGSRASLAARQAGHVEVIMQPPAVGLVGQPDQRAAILPATIAAHVGARRPALVRERGGLEDGSGRLRSRRSLARGVGPEKSRGELSLRRLEPS